MDFFRFAFMTVPYANYSPGDSARSPGKDDETLIKPPDSYTARLAVVVALIWPREMRASKDFLCTKHVEPSREQGPLSLGPIARDAHVIIVATLNKRVNQLGTTLTLWFNDRWIA